MRPPQPQKSLVQSSDKFVPFGGDPAKDRPTAQESKDEINAIRKFGQTDDYRRRYGPGWSAEKAIEAGQI